MTPVITYRLAYTQGMTTLCPACAGGSRHGRGALGAVSHGDDVAYGFTFGAWLDAAGRTGSASQYDLRAAWRAGESPEDYAGGRAQD